MPQINFDAASVEPSQNMTAIPAGKYQAVISQSIMKPTRSGNGQYLELTFEIISGEYNGRKLWTRLNLDNPSQKAVDIARQELSAICHAVNVMSLHDTEQLHNLPMTITVKRMKKESSDEDANEVKGYAPAVSAVPAAVKNTAPVQKTPNSTPPWTR